MRLGGFARPILFFILAKTHRGGQDAEPQRNCGPLLSANGATPSRSAAADRDRLLTRGSGGFILAKTHLGGQDAEAQRNSGPLGLTFRRGGLCAFPTLQPVPQDCGSLPRRIIGPPRRIFLFFTLAKAQSRKEIVVHFYPRRRTGGNLIKKQMEASEKKEALFYIPSLGILNLSF